MRAMTIDERLEAVAVELDTLTRIHIDNDREYRDRFERLAETQEKNARDIQGLARDLEKAHALLLQDFEKIRALARVAELHHERLNRLEDR